MQELRGKIAVVTGGASGIGLGLAERFAAEGMRVAIADVEETALRRAEDALRATGADVIAVRTDVARAADVDALAERTLQAFGAVHVVCNNAGVGGDVAPTWEQTLEGWQWVLGVNLWGVIHGIRTFVPILLRQGVPGHVVNTASMAGLISMPLGAAYHASKHAVVTITESLHWELQATGTPVRASVLCPGFVRTNIMDDARNRPAALGAKPPPSELVQSLRETFRVSVASGLPPAAVADCVVDAIRSERFYVFPHPDLLGAVRERAEAIVAQRDPGTSLG